MSATCWVTRDNLTDAQRLAACDTVTWLAAAARRAVHAGDTPFARAYAGIAREALQAFGTRLQQPRRPQGEAWLTPHQAHFLRRFVTETIR